MRKKRRNNKINTVQEKKVRGRENGRQSQSFQTLQRADVFLPANYLKEWKKQKEWTKVLFCFSFYCCGHSVQFSTHN